MEGKIGLYYKNLKTGNIIEVNKDELFTSASIIKIPILIEVLRQYRNKTIDIYSKYELLDKDKVSSCGILNTLDSGIMLSIKDLYTMMIVISDNTATNILIDLVGMDNVNNTMRNLGYKNIKLNRKMMDFCKLDAGIDNYISPIEIADILEKIYKRQILDEEMSIEMERVLKLQKINHKIPYFIDNNIEIAHKTGENDGVTHDVSIIYTKNPFILCFFSNDTDIASSEKFIRELAYELCLENDR